MTLTKDTTVTLPSGRRGVVLEPPGSSLLMPRHCLVELPNGDRQWFLASICKPVSPAPPPVA